MKKNNIILLIFIMILIVIAGVFTISKISKRSNPTAQGIPCAYVFKTIEEGPFEMGYIVVKSIPEESGTFLSVSPTRIEVTQLAGEYSYFVARCPKDSTDVESSWVLISKDYNFEREISEDNPNIFIEPFNELWSCPPEGGIDSLNSIIENGLESKCIKMETPKFSPYINKNID